MLSIEMVNALNHQLTLERTNEVYFRALAAAADVVNRPGAKAFFSQSANEEADHARYITEYLVDRNYAPNYDTLAEIPDINGNDYADMFRLALIRERVTTASLIALYEMADPQTIAFLINPSGDFPGFMAEQTHSERELVDMLTSIGRLSEDGIELFDKNLV